MRVSSEEKYVYSFFAVLSIMSSLLIPLIYSKSKKCRHHPAQIIAAISICECLSSYHLFVWAVDVKDFVHFFRIDSALQVYSFARVSTVHESQFYLCTMNNCLYNIFLTASILYNICLCFDLMITLKYPIFSGRRRNKYYHLFSVTLTFIVFLIIRSSVSDKCEQDQRILYIDYVPIQVLQYIFILLGMISITLGLIDYRTNSNNALMEPKRKYLIRHVLNVLLLTFIWIVPAIRTFKNLFDFYSLSDNNSLDIVAFIILINTGFFLALLRLSESYFYLRAKVLILSIFKRASPEDLKFIEESEQNDDENTELWNTTLTSLINSTMNMELVKFILISVLEVLDDRNVRASTRNDTVEDHGDISMNDLSRLARAKRFLQKDKINLELLKIKKPQTQDSQPKSQNILMRSINNLMVRMSSRDSQNIKARSKDDCPELTQNLIESKILSENETDSITISLKITEHAPNIFRLLRNSDLVSYQTIYKSLNLFANEQAIKDAKESAGQSGSFFFFSHDKKFILKTLVQSELDTLLNHMLPEYYTYIIHQNENSLLSRMYGAFSIDIGGMSTVHLILMENTIGENSAYLSRIYDLKGSLVNRKTKSGNIDLSQEERADEPHSNDGTPKTNQERDKKKAKKVKIYKDLNFLESSDLFIMMEHKKKEMFLETLNRDVNFLKTNKIMDYSLLFAIAEIPSGEMRKFELHSYKYEKEFKDWRKFRSRPGSQEVWSFAIIDYLQLFNTYKYLEFRYKALIYYKKSYYVSCIDPVTYANRFTSFMASIFCSLIKN